MVVENTPYVQQVAKGIKRSTADSKFLASRWDSIARRHKNRWVGVHNKKLIYADTLPKLLNKARAKDWGIESMVVAHLEPKRGAVLLRVGNSGIL